MSTNLMIYFLKDIYSLDTPFRNPVISQGINQEALIRLLIQKRIFSLEEFSEMVKVVDKEIANEIDNEKHDFLYTRSLLKLQKRRSRATLLGAFTLLLGWGLVVGFLSNQDSFLWKLLAVLTIALGPFGMGYLIKWLEKPIQKHIKFKMDKG